MMRQRRGGTLPSEQKYTSHFFLPPFCTELASLYVVFYSIRQISLLRSRDSISALPNSHCDYHPLFRPLTLKMQHFHRIRLKLAINLSFFILLHVHPMLGNGLVNNFPRRQILGKQSIAWSRKNKTNVYSSLLGNDQREWTDEIAIMWLVFNVVDVMTSAKQQNCKHVYNNRCFQWRIVPKVRRGPWRSFAVSHSWEAMNQRHEAVTERSPGGFSSWEYKDENWTCPTESWRIIECRLGHRSTK
jgi:hypothetical protein